MKNSILLRLDTLFTSICLLSIHHRILIGNKWKCLFIRRTLSCVQLHWHRSEFSSVPSTANGNSRESVIARIPAGIPGNYWILGGNLREFQKFANLVNFSLGFWKLSTIILCNNYLWFDIYFSDTEASQGLLPSSPWWWWWWSSPSWELIVPSFSNSNHQLLHSSQFSRSLCSFWCRLLFQWYIATIDTWFHVWFSICRGYLESRTIGFDQNQKLLMTD